MERLKGIAKGAEMMAVAGLVAMRRHLEMGQEADMRIRRIAAARDIPEDAAEAHYARIVDFSRASLFSIDVCWTIYAAHMLRDVPHDECMKALDERHIRHHRFGVA